jgi:ATP-binding cassette subfamily B protein
MLERIDGAGWADPYGAVSLIRRVLREQGLVRWRSYTLAFALMGIAAASTSAVAYLVGHLVNQAYVSRNFAMIVTVSLMTMAAFTAKGLAVYGQAIVLARIANEITAENQRKLVDTLLRQNLAYFADRPTASLMAQVTYGAGAAPGLLNLLISGAGRSGLALIGLGTVMVIGDPVLCLVALVVMPPAGFFMRRLLQRIRTVTRDQFAGGASLMETMQESLQGLRTVKAFGLEGDVRHRVAANADAMEQAGNELARVSNRSGPLMEWLGGCAVALVFLYAGFSVVVKGAAPGSFVSCITAFLLAFEPAKRLARMPLDLSNALVGVRMLYELIDTPPTEADEGDKPPLRVGAGQVEFADVEFAYRAAEPVLRGMSFVAAPGRVTALVGPSGGGKSTVLSLILRFYEARSGAILIDGQDISCVARGSVRGQIAYVSQDVFLFQGSVEANIALGRPGAGSDEIVAAARAACAHDFIMSFAQGYATPVGEHGLQLSAGQRQRISVARALLRNASIILLDEPTAALDNESEFAVQQAIAHLCRGRTTIVVAHRLHTVVHADSILVVENGAVVEAGRHEELLRAGARYAALYRLILKDEARPEPRIRALGAV